jgi:hypothetical protein
MIYIITIGLVLALMLGFVIVEYLAHRFAKRHPEFGPPRKLGCGGCGEHYAGHCESSEH